MKTALTLVNPSDLDLDMAFADHIAGYEAKVPRSAESRYWVRPKGLGIWSTGRAYTTSVDSVLPYLTSASGWYTIEYNDHHDYPLRPPSYTVHLHEAGKGLRAGTKAEDTSLARAMVIALLRAKGVGITFS